MAFPNYIRLPALFVTVGRLHWNCMGFAVPVLIAMLLLFCRKKEYGLLKALVLICIAVFMLPYFGHALNGFSYAENRWCWAFVLQCAYILTVMWPSLMELGEKDRIILLVCTMAYFICCLVARYFVWDKVHVGNVAVAGFTVIPEQSLHEMQT